MLLKDNVLDMSVRPFLRSCSFARYQIVIMLHRVVDLAECIAFMCFCDTERILSPTAKFLVHLLGRTGAGSKGSGRGGERVVATPFYSVVIRPDELMSW